ncbi:hypothetical protein EWM64_g2574 [Hericium alpestre]|uniref:Presequence translocated-associated motor subunit PAM17 n=1 Tax=Hericium alpestre TaxID=135208 RepID=A0A4Z0A3Z2_9AGAM|nr:hypothetical protein EWM64_g2574 [Hericium alpestre]
MATSLQRSLARSFACSSRSSTIFKLNANSPARVFSRSKTTSASQGQKETLPWAEYLAIRKGKRRWEMALTIPCMAAGFVGGATYFGSLEMDATKPIMGIDPLFFFGGATLSCIGQ